MKQGILLITIGLVLLSAASAMAEPLSGVGDVAIHLNGGADVAYIGDTNTVEFWIKNDVQLIGLMLGFEFSIGRNYTFDPAHGTANFGYAKPVGDAVGSFDLYHGETAYIDNISTDSILISGVAMMSNFPAHATHALCYTMAVYIPPGQAELIGGFCVDNIFIPPSGSWTFVEQGGYGYAPNFQGNPNSSESNPDAPPVCFDIVIPSLTIVPAPPGFTYVPNVPDWNQPPFSGATNYCAPVSALNIVDYWQSNLSFGGLVDPADAAVYPSGSATADLIGYFMGTNGVGCPRRINQGIWPGTHFTDEAPGLDEYIKWNTPGQFGPDATEPTFPAWKIGYSNAIVALHQLSNPELFNLLVAEISSGWPSKIDFNYWNPINADTAFIDGATQDTIFVYQWGANTGGSGPPNPQEEWDYDVGHAVTGVGYIPMWNGIDWAIVHDNWPTTRAHIAIPWANLMALVTAQPPSTSPPDTGDVPNPSFELGQLGQVPTSWVRQDSSIGPGVTTWHDMKSVNTHYFDGERSLYMYAKCKDAYTAASYSSLTYAWTENWINCPNASRVRLHIRDIATTHSTYWGWGTHILLFFTDGVNTVSASPLFDRGEGYDNNHYTYIDSVNSDDGFPWYVYVREIPASIDQTHMKIGIRCHAGGWSWHGYETSLGFYADIVELLPSDSLVFYPTQDATIDEFYPNNCHGLEDWLVARRGGTGFKLDALLQFDLSMIPTGAAIDSATLGFYYDHYQDGNPAGKNLTVHRNTGSWNESTVTWNNAPGYDPTVISTATVPGGASWMEWNVTSSVQDMVDGLVSNDGWRVVDPSGSGFFTMIYFPSKQHVTYKPYLRIVRKAVALDCMPGDADGNGTIDIDDVVYLLAYIFSGGPSPTPYEICSGDAGCSCAVDIDDVTYLIAYIFMSGPPPCGCDEWVTQCDMPLRVSFDGDEDGDAPGDEQALSKTVEGTASLSMLDSRDGLKTNLLVSIEANREVQALQLDYEITGEVRDMRIESLIDGIQEFHGIADDVLKVGLLDLRGQTMIPAGGAEIINISFVGDGEIELVGSIAVARGGGRLNTTRNSLVADAIVPKSYVLHQNKPNPFNPATEIAFTLPIPSHVKLDVFNILGQKVTTLIDGYRPTGDHTVTWEGKDGNGAPAASGVYFYRMEAGDYIESKKMLLLK